MIELLSDYPLLKYVLLLSLFAVITAGCFFAATAINARQMARQRLSETGTMGDLAGVAGSLRSDRVESNWMKLVDRIEKTGLSLVDSKDMKIRQLLFAAGYTASYAPRVYTLVRLIGVVVFPALVLLNFWVTAASPSLTTLYFSVVIAAVIGLYLPVLVVRARAARRQRDIINGFPDALDLMLVCVEAGLGLEAAFARVGMEMTDSHPRIAEQLGTVVLELRAGRNREDALRRLADRAGADEIRAFATLLIQSTKLGSSVAQTLRIYAAEMRERRRLRAEERAHRLPVLLSIPLVACMLPVMIGVLMLPAAIRVMRAILPALKATGAGG
jgi:tight adherence protein C